MSNSPRSRRSRAFRPGNIGFDQLEDRKLLTVDPTLVCIPDAVANFDPNNYTLVDSDTFDAHLEVVEGGLAYGPPSEIPGGDSGDLATLTQYINDQVDGLVQTVNGLITNYQAHIANETNISAEMGKLIVRATAIRDNPIATPGQVADAQNIIDSTAKKKEEVDKRIIDNNKTIEYLKKVKFRLLQYGPIMITSIQQVNMSADPTMPPVYSYHVDSLVVDFSDLS